MDKISCVSRYLDIKIHILSLLTESFCESRTSAPIGKTRTESCEISPSSFSSRAPDLVRLLPKSNCRLSSRFNYFARNNTKASRFFARIFSTCIKSAKSRDFNVQITTCNFITFWTFRILLGEEDRQSLGKGKIKKKLQLEATVWLLSRWSFKCNFMLSV